MHTFDLLSEYGKTHNLSLATLDNFEKYCTIIYAWPFRTGKYRTETAIWEGLLPCEVNPEEAKQLIEILDDLDEKLNKEG